MGLQKRKMPATVLKTVPAAFDIWLGEATSSKENCVGIQQSKHSSYIVSLRFHHTFYHTLCWQWCSSAKEVLILQFHREINDVTGGALTDYFNFMPLWWNLTTKSSRVLCEMHHLWNNLIIPRWNDNLLLHHCCSCFFFLCPSSIPKPPTVVSAARAALRSKRGFGSITIAGQTSKILRASLLLFPSLLSLPLSYPPTSSSLPPHTTSPLAFVSVCLCF